MDTQKLILMILDGWGLAEDESVSAIHASGLRVGLPDDQMGNSEVGHMNIGAGRVVYQDLVKINLELDQNTFEHNREFKALCDYCKSKEKPLHVMGLLSDGGVHSSIEHLRGIIRELSEAEVPEVYFHCFMDGRVTSPTGGDRYLDELIECINEHKIGKIASIMGRYYAMDRDKRWERTKKAYDLLVHGEGNAYNNPKNAILRSYDRGVTDEFVEPAVIMEDEEPVATIKDGDAVFFYNFRTDRGRQLTQVLTQADMPEHGMKKLDLYYATLTRYDKTFENIHVLYEKAEIQNGLGEVLSNMGKSQIRIAETEKYPHVTFFFNGGRENAMDKEVHMMCPSPKVATYDLAPEMSAYDIRDKILPEIQKQSADFICLNFANPDMVGHTGVFEAAVKACEVVDECARAVAEAALENDYIVLITADHGNADKMINPDETPHTAHTTALVPFFLLDKNDDFKLKPTLGKLGDIAPTILTLMGLDIPKEMDGTILVEPN